MNKHQSPRYRQRAVPPEHRARIRSVRRYQFGGTLADEMTPIFARRVPGEGFTRHLRLLRAAAWRARWSGY